MQEEAFVKSQLIAFCKALSKVEAPLKQKHVRALVVGTHKLRSSRIFWHAVSRVQLEKNPVLSWKFCQLLHKLIHDGHRKVTEESVNHVNRLTQLGNFWQHLRSSGYGQANTCYCKLLVSRLQFHKKYPSIPGNLNINQRQLEVLTADVNETYELTIDILDQMEELLNLKATIMQIMDALRWSSLVPQGQCLLAPLILVILDTSKLYDYSVKALFKLHSNLPADTLVGHRERFYEIFRRTKKFYEETGNLQYFKYLVQIPTLPTTAPNFQQASELDDYQPPQAYLHATTTSESGDQTPPDAQSVSDEQINTIIDISMPQMDTISMAETTFSALTGPSTSQETATLFDPKDEIIARLRQDIDVERETKERLIQEARMRIEQYETRLVQMKQEIDLHKEAAEEKTKELEELRAKGTTNQEQEKQSKEEIERKANESEQKYAKLKGVYQQLREDHIKALTEIKELRAKIEANNNATDRKEEELQAMKREFEQSLEELMKALPSEGKGDLDAETVGKQLEEEMKRMDEAIAAAVAHIDELQKKSREENSGRRLEVNDKILHSCNALMNAVRELVIRSKEVQEEIVKQGGGATTNPVEFYKKNHLWTEGLISGGRAVGVAATELLKSADSLIMGRGGKFEHLIVAAQSVGASVAQLFVSSRVKVEKGSKNMVQLGAASKAVNKCTAELVGTVKNGQQSLAEEQLLDFSNLSLHEAKKEEMESQVRTLELEAELTKERLRLAALRKQHFHLAQLVSNKQENGNKVEKPEETNS